jgi:hypothetical protein
LSHIFYFIALQLAIERNQLGMLALLLPVIECHHVTFLITVVVLWLGSDLMERRQEDDFDFWNCFYIAFRDVSGVGVLGVN